jgi:transcription elongation GreA/GreB family factor
MTDEQALQWAAAAGFHSASLLYIYNGKKEALCPSELDELEAIKYFAKLVRNSTLEDAAVKCDEWSNSSNVSYIGSGCATAARRIREIAQQSP